MKKIRLLVVDDSFFMRRLISDLLKESGIIEVIDTAKNGIEAIEKTISLSPDIITLDVEMPKMDGIEALQKIMNQRPVPIIMLSSLTEKGADTTIRALELGAFDFIAKPSGAISFDIKKIKNELIDKILIAHSQHDKWSRQWEIRNNPKKIEKKENIIEEDIQEEDIQEASTVEYNIDELINSNETFDTLNGILAIGTSTGGPKALQEVITKIPKNFPYAILIVQHMPPGFTKSLADRLNTLSEINVVEAKDKQRLKPGTAYIAPGNYHMTASKHGVNYLIKLNQDDPVSGHRPSVDVLYQSLANINLRKIFVIMTGMGSDGTKGLIKAKKEDSDITIAEDENTCVVFGMPKMAIQSGYVDKVVPLYNITNNILKSVKKQRGWQSWN